MSGGGLSDGASPAEPETLDGRPWEWTHGFYPTEQQAIDAYNRLYPEGARSGVVGNVVPIDDRFRLDLTRWPEASRRKES